MHELVLAGFTMQLEVKAADPAVANAPAPESTSVKFVDVPGSRVLVCATAEGAVGVPTVGVIVAKADCEKESAAAYLILVATPLNVGSGVKITVDPEIT